VEVQPTDLPSVQHLRVRNDHPFAVQFTLEPWAEEVTMPPNKVFEVIATGPEGDFLEVMLSDLRITVYGWSGSVASVFDGREKVIDCQIPAPRLPSRPAGDARTTP
jgi:hypothetical protein